jgi:hypothetical protein
MSRRTLRFPNRDLKRSRFQVEICDGNKGRYLLKDGDDNFITRWLVLAPVAYFNQAVTLLLALTVVFLSTLIISKIGKSVAKVSLM